MLTWLAAVAMDDIIVPSVYTATNISARDYKDVSNMFYDEFATTNNNTSSEKVDNIDTTNTNNNNNNNTATTASNNNTSTLRNKEDSLSLSLSGRNMITQIEVRAALWPFNYTVSQTFDIVESARYGHYEV